MDAVPSREWYCVVCHRSIEANLDDRVEVSFTPDLGVRPLEIDAFGSIESYWRMYFSANFERSGELQAFLKAKALGLWLVRPGAQAEFTFEARPGTAYRLLSLDAHSEVMLNHTRASASRGTNDVDVSVSETGLSPGEVAINEGPVRVRVTNRGKLPVGLMGTEVDWEGLTEVIARAPSRMHPFLTAKMLLNNQTFRDLFRVQTLDADLRLRLRSLTLLFTDLKGSTELYDRTGDLRAYAFVREHFKVLSDAVKRHRGAIIKTMGDAIMASFNEPTDAAKAAVEMMAGMDALNAGMKKEGHDTGLKVGLHEGPALAVTSEERLDYFGQTVNVAARVQGLASAGEIWATTSVMSAPGVGPVMSGAGYQGEAREVSLKGVGGKTHVHRLSR
jgi:class 3 adenylate cyclase